MDRKIKQIDIVFENCEVCTLTPAMIEMCLINGINNDIGINCFQYTDGEVYDRKNCDSLMLSINQKGLSQHPGFGDYIDDKHVLEERIKYNDITNIDVIYEDGSNDYIGVPWKNKNGNEYINELQNNVYYTIHNEECLLIIIQRTKLTLGELGDRYGIN